MVEIHIIHIQLCQTLIQHCLQILGLLHLVHRTLGRYIHLIPEGLQSFAHCDFAVVVAVIGGCIKIVDTLLIGMAQHFIDLGLIHDPGAVLLLDLRQTHAAKAQGRNIYTGISEFAVLHNFLLFRLNYHEAKIRFS